MRKPASHLSCIASLSALLASSAAPFLLPGSAAHAACTAAPNIVCTGLRTTQLAINAENTTLTLPDGPNGFLVNNNIAVRANEDNFTLSIGNGAKVEVTGTSGIRAVDLDILSQASITVKNGGSIIDNSTAWFSNALKVTKSTNVVVTVEAGGEISGRNEIVELSGGVFLNNSGLITKTINQKTAVVQLGGGNLLNNAGGVISGGGGSAVSIGNGSFGVGGSVTNRGTIDATINGGNGVAIFGGIGSDTVTNSGTIRASKSAILLEGGDDILELQAGSQIKGFVFGGGSVDTLRFGGNSAERFDLSEIGGSQKFRQFEIFSVTGGTWTFTGTAPTAADNDGTAGNFTVTGGTVMGTGSFQDLTLTGGTLTPGNSIGTVNVLGKLAFAAGATYEAELAANGTSDLINVTGSASLTGGDVNVTFTDPEANYTDGTRYTIVTAAKGVAGKFDKVTDGSALLDTTLVYDANNVFVDVTLQQTTVATTNADGTTTTTTGPNFPSFAATGNQQGVANALVGFDLAGNPDINQALLGLNEAGLQNAYNSIGGENHAGTQSGANQNGGMFGRSLFNQAGGNGGGQTTALAVPAEGIGALTSAELVSYYASDVTLDKSGKAGEAIDAVLLAESREAIYGADILTSDVPQTVHNGPSVWLSGLYGHAEVDGSSGASGFTSDAFGISGGIEQDLAAMGHGDVTVGLGIGYSASYNELDSRAHSSTSDDYHIGLYVGGGADRLSTGFNWTAAASYSFHEIDSHRTISFGAINRLATAGYNARTTSGTAELRYNFEAPASGFGRTVIAPLVSASLSSTSTDGFTERGAGALNLTVQSATFTQTWLGAGLGISGDYDLGAFTWRPNWSVAFEHNVGDDQASSSATLAGSPTAFTSRGPSEDRNRLRFGSSTTFNLSDTAELTLSSNSIWSPDRTEWSGKATFKLAF